jgi:hypothetical protein
VFILIRSVATTIKDIFNRGSQFHFQVLLSYYNYNCFNCILRFKTKVFYVILICVNILYNEGNARVKKIQFHQFYSSLL